MRGEHFQGRVMLAALLQEFVQGDHPHDGERGAPSSSACSPPLAAAAGGCRTPGAAGIGAGGAGGRGAGTPGSAGLRGLPSSAYYPPGGAPPPELAGLAPGSLDGVDVGYVSITIDRRHVGRPRLDGLVWQLVTFYMALRHQTQLLSVFLHSHIRRRLGALHGNLERARVPLFAEPPADS